jgi:hypothetical protein
MATRLEIADKNIIERLIQLLTRGSIKLQTGQYCTQKSIEKRKKNLKKYSFKAN